MSTISTANFLIETKRMAAMIDLIETAYGDGDDTNTPSKGAANALAAVAALGDNEQLNALLPEAVRFADRMKYENQYNDLIDWLRAFNQHVNGLNDYLEDNLLHIHYHLRKVDESILPRWVFPPVTDFGTFTLSGAGVGSWVAQDTVDTDEYGDGLVELVTESAIGASEITVTIPGTNYDGETVQVTATIPASTGTGVTIAVNETTVRMATVDGDNISVSGGTAADAFRVQTKFDRTPTGCA